LELHIAEEDSKYGFNLDDCRNLLEEGEWRELKNVHISGLMMMASNTDDTEQIRKEMTLAANFFDEVKAKYFADDPEFKERSWGMSSDYEIAIDCRSTMIRVGTAIFGPRVY
jgi:pyridoxal phosphate enzyme, yggS family